MPMAGTIATNIDDLTGQLGEKARLVAVSKTKPVSAIEEAYATGHRVFGENKAQELAAKHPQLPQDIEWHFIGHLQTNKVKYIAPFVHLIHAVDSLKLLKEINKRAAQNERVIDYLLQLRIAKEETKFGLTREGLLSLMDDPEWSTLTNVRLCGLMGMATHTDDTKQIKDEFGQMAGLFDELKAGRMAGQDQFRELSMGMTNDYPLAVAAGSTLIRIGSAIFGAREYPV